MNPFFSIIIPVYNSEETIQNCIISILKQDFCNFEVIIIDDGSTDESWKTCQHIAKDNEHIVLIHQNNQGVSATRNQGMNIAKGEYILFVDSDDFITENTLKRLHERINNDKIDLCFFGYQYMSQGHIQSSNLPDEYLGEKNGNTLLNLIKSNTFGMACNKLIRRDLLINNKLIFNKDIKVFEDQEFMIRVWNMASSILCIQEALYCYVNNERSTMHRFRQEQCDRYFSAQDDNIKRLCLFMHANGIDASLIDTYMYEYASTEIGNIIRMAGLTKPDEYSLFKERLVKSRLLEAFSKTYRDQENKTVKERIFHFITKNKSMPLLRAVGKIATAL